MGESLITRSISDVAFCRSKASFVSLNNRVFFYLVRGVNDCSGDAAPAGTDSTGAPRTPGLCPGPPPP